MKSKIKNEVINIIRKELLNSLKSMRVDDQERRIKRFVLSTLYYSEIGIDLIDNYVRLSANYSKIIPLQDWIRGSICQDY